MDTHDQTALAARVDAIEHRLADRPVSTPEHAERIETLRATQIANGQMPQDGLRDDVERAAFSAARARMLEGGV